ncbi:MAG: hypothetical protein QXM15_04745, partial [Archaeoglobaceae archaeon]
DEITSSEEPQSFPVKRGRPRKNPEDASDNRDVVTVGGFELKSGLTESDARRIEELTQQAEAATSHIAAKDAETLSDYLAFGRFQSEVAPLFKSTKVYGQFLAANLPATQALDPALRSNCKWLYEALNKPDHEASDILIVLAKAEGMETIPNDLSGFRSKNPTVIRRLYKEAKTRLEKERKAAEEGIGVEELQALEKEAKKARAKEADEALSDGLIAFREWLGTARNKDKAVEGAVEILEALLKVCELSIDAKEQAAAYLLDTCRVPTTTD